MKKTLMLVLLSGLVLNACDRTETIEDIDQKATNRWQALVNNDYAKAYEYLAPSFRGLESLKTYETRMATAKLSIDWQDAEFVSKKCEEDICRVNMKITYIYRFPQRSMGEAELTTNKQENWIKRDSKWYHLPDEKKEL